MAQLSRSELEVFVAREYPRVVAAVGMVTGDREGAADAVQDALLGYLAKPPVRPVENLPAWIVAVASNRLRDQHRTRAAESRAFAKVGESPVSGEDPVGMLDVDVRRALEALPLRQRRICALHYLLDQSVEQIATGLGITTGTVKTQLHRARAALGATLRPEPAEEIPA